MLSNEIQSRVAKEFDCLGDVVFLSSSFTTMPPRCVQKVFPAFMERWLRTFSNSEWGDWTASEQEEGRRQAAQLLHCEPEEIAFVKNTTEGIGIMASGYPWEKGKNIVIPEREHGANLHSWIPLHDRGIPLKAVEASDPQKGLTADDLIAAIDENTQAVVTSVIQFWDGAFVDMEKLGRACKERGVLLIVDAIQAVGRMDVDVKKWNIDWLACGSHKGLFALEGGGIVYCAPNLLEKIMPPCIGLEGTTQRSHILEPDGMRVHFKEGAARLEGGSVNTLGVMSIAESCKFLLSIGMENIERHILDLETMCLGMLKSRSRVRVAGDRMSGIIMADFPAEKRDQALEILAKHHINATVRPDNVRFCISFFNTEAHMRILAEAITALQAL